SPRYFEVIPYHNSSVYSVRRLFAGLAVAAFIDCPLTVIRAIATAISPARANIHHFIYILYAKPSSHEFMLHQAIGEAMRMAINTGFIKSFDKRVTIPPVEAPNTLRMPISLIRCSAA